MNQNTVIQVTNLTKSYNGTPAVNDTTWSLQPGRLMGFLGPNGAGKSTTIRILLGFLKPTAGNASVFKLNTWQHATDIHARVGYLPGEVRLYKNLNGRQTIKFTAAARKLPDQSEADRLADLLDLDLTKAVRAYSSGMRQKLALILAMMHKPELLILDEPTSALDPLVQQSLYAELRNTVAEGRTVLFSSHTLAEVQSLCQDVIILRQGRVVASTTIDKLRADAGQSLTFKLKGTENDGFKKPDQLSIDKTVNGQCKARWHGDINDLTAWLASQPLTEVRIEPPSLEDLFLSYYDGSNNP